jgi:tripartite-type tricarboxylate transporter receptor subunit TctC
VPADRVAALRQAFDELMKDKEFLAAAESRRLTISPRNAAAVQALVNKIVSASPALVERVKVAIGQTE